MKNQWEATAKNQTNARTHTHTHTHACICQEGFLASLTPLPQGWDLEASED